MAFYHERAAFYYEKRLIFAVLSDLGNSSRLWLRKTNRWLRITVKRVKTGSRVEITLKIVSSPKITHKTGSRVEITLKIVSSPKITHKTSSRVVITLKTVSSLKIIT